MLFAFHRFLYHEIYIDLAIHPIDSSLLCCLPKSHKLLFGELWIKASLEGQVALKDTIRHLSSLIQACNVQIVTTQKVQPCHTTEQLQARCRWLCQSLVVAIYGLVRCKVVHMKGKLALHPGVLCECCQPRTQTIVNSNIDLLFFCFFPMLITTSHEQQHDTHQNQQRSWRNRHLSKDFPHRLQS